MIGGTSNTVLNFTTDLQIDDEIKKEQLKRSSHLNLIVSDKTQIKNKHNQDLKLLDLKDTEFKAIISVNKLTKVDNNLHVEYKLYTVKANIEVEVEPTFTIEDLE